MSLYSVLFRPHTFYTHFWGPSTGNTSINCGEFNRGPQRRSGAGALTVWEKAEGTVLSQPGDEMAFGRASSSLPMPTRLFSRRQTQASHSGAQKETKDSQHKLKCKKCFRLGTRRKTLNIRTAKHWKRLPEEVVLSPSLEVFKIQPWKTLSNLVWPHSWPSLSQRLD